MDVPSSTIDFSRMSTSYFYGTKPAVNISISVITGCYVQDKGFGDASKPVEKVDKS